MPRFVVDLASLSSAVLELERGIAQVEGELSALAGYLRPLEAAWSGGASAAYEAYRREWDRAAAELAGSLRVLHGIAGVAHANYGAAVAANARVWGG